ncbi:hypothetical protein H9P43_001386 [Blastocladiella emersonii ATCC 22665]|nr:hypothetical protein H9P43_001386 [Blastocladiella emersonii ATCC 22665]
MPAGDPPRIETTRSSSSATASPRSPSPRRPLTAGPEDDNAPAQSAEYYGFVVYVLSLLSWLAYLAWALLPDSVLHRVGIYYYPDRWWAIAVPSWGIVTVCFVLVYTQLHILRGTPDPSEAASVTDCFARTRVSHAYDLYDLPLGEVSRNLHLRRPRRAVEEAEEGSKP